MRNPVIALLVCALSVCAITTAASADNAESSTASLIADRAGENCPKFVRRLTSRPSKVVDAHPVSVEDTCACADRKLRSDPVFSAIGGDVERLKAQVRNPDFRPYLESKVAAYQIQCYADQLSRSSDAYIGNAQP